MNTLRTFAARHALTAMRLCAPLCAFIAFGTLNAQIIAPQDANQFRVTLANSSTYIVRDTGTYYTIPGSWTFNDMTFTNSGTDAENQAAVYVVGTDELSLGATVFTGSNLTILGSGTSGASRRALAIGLGANVILTDSVIRQTEASAATGAYYAVYITSNSQLIGTNLTIEAAGPQVSAVSLADYRLNRLILDGSVVSNSGSAAAIRMAGAGTVMLTSSTISTTGDVAPGFQSIGGRAYFILDGGLIQTTGALSPGLWLGGGTISSSFGNGITEFTGVLQDALVRADTGMGIELNTNLPGLGSRPGIANPQPTIAGYYDLTVVSSTISGALGAFRMTSSATSGTTITEMPTIVRMKLTDSALEGDVFVNDGAQFILNGASSRLDGALRISGTAPTAAVTLAGSAITGGIVLSGNAALDLSADNTTITGTLAASGSATAKVLLTGGSTIDAVAFTGSSTLELTLDNTSRVLGDFSFSGGATYTLLPADNRALVFPNALALAAGGNLRIAPATRLTLTAPLTLADPTAVISIADARGDDLVLAAGLTGNGRLIVQGIHSDALGEPELRVIRDDTGALASDAFTLAAPAAGRLFAYHGLENRHDGVYLTGGGFSPAGAAIINTSALAAADFFDALAPVSRHLSGLRESGTMGAGARYADGDSGAFWLSGNTAYTTVGGDAPGLGFRQQTFALSTGADLRWGGGNGRPAMTAGVFAGTSYSHRDFSGDADGRTTTFGGGLYALYQRPAGWHAALTLRVEKADHDLDVRDLLTSLAADYSVNAFGATLQFGRFMSGFSPSGWWAEPSVEIGYAGIGSASYDTRSADAAYRFHVRQDAITAIQGRAQIAFGRELYKKWSLRTRVAGAWLNTSGGGITGGGITKPGFLVDGIRAEASVGFFRQFGPTNRLWIDCDAVLAADYKRPCMLSIGFAKAW